MPLVELVEALRAEPVEAELVEALRAELVEAPYCYCINSIKLFMADLVIVWAFPWRVRFVMTVSEFNVVVEFSFIG